VNSLYRIYSRICELTIVLVVGYLLWQFTAGLVDCVNFGHWPIENDHPTNHLDVDPRSTS
jgi:hypothetical protein